MIEDENLGFFKKVTLSIKDLDKYDQLAIQPVRKTIKYFIKLILIFAFLLSVIYSVKVYKFVNVAKDKVNEVPEFKYENGNVIFQENKPVIIENISDLLNSVLILPNADEDTQKEYTMKAKTYNSYLTINTSNFVISVKGNTLQYDYKDVLENYNIKSFNKADVVSFINEIQAVPLSISFCLVMTISLFIFYFISLGLDIVITYIVGYITARIARIRLKVSALVNISIYSLTLSIILYLIYSIVNIFTDFEIRNFRLMYILIASIYSAIAVLIIKADFIEKQQEIAKVIKEQQEIRKEQLREEEDKQNNEEKDDNVENKEENNESSKDNGELNDNTDEPILGENFEQNNSNLED